MHPPEKTFNKDCGHEETTIKWARHFLLAKSIHNSNGQVTVNKSGFLPNRRNPYINITIRATEKNVLSISQKLPFITEQQF